MLSVTSDPAPSALLPSAVPTHRTQASHSTSVALPRERYPPPPPPPPPPGSHRLQPRPSGSPPLNPAPTTSPPPNTPTPSSVDAADGVSHRSRC
eukprot:1267018-Rhodomonas_salina.3